MMRLESGTRWDLLLAVMGAPHASDMVTTVLRLVDASLRHGARVQVWTCGYATLLTQRSLGQEKPRNLHDLGTDCPTTATLVGGMIAEAAGSLAWHVCRFCGDERGASEHVPGVRVRPPFSFADQVRSATKTVFVGVI